MGKQKKTIILTIRR